MKEKIRKHKWNLNINNLFDKYDINKVKIGSIGVFGNSIAEIEEKLNMIDKCPFYKERVAMIDKDLTSLNYVTENNQHYSYFYFLRYVK